MDCTFCNISPERKVFSDPDVIAIWDAFPVSPGHALLIPTRHISSWFEATPAERAALGEASVAIQCEILTRHAPSGFNVGINVGESAGQTVSHLHVHVIPRYDGDVPDPRGGIRGVIPAKRIYDPTLPQATSSRSRHLIRGGDADPFYPELVAHVASATSLDIAVAFTLARGVELLFPHLEDLLARGGRFRFLTGDYMDSTEPDALRRLLDLQGHADLRVYETDGVRAFHPKSYVVRRGDEESVAFVGSSNVSESALRHGIEWNYRVGSTQSSLGFREISEAFEEIFNSGPTRTLTPEWIESYEKRRRVRELLAPTSVHEVPDEPYGTKVPHEVQREALAALQASRAVGNKAGLVVLATGLGKTWLSAFDAQAGGFKRVLFVAHREEILSQAMDTFRQIRPSARLGLYNGTSRDQHAEVVFASIQTLGRTEHLNRFDAETFDYVVIDEFHHASAASYRKVINHFTPRFLLGLTATPERTDGGNLFALCHENLVYRCDLAEGIRRGLLSPFHYFGVPDEVDYSNIPWRSNRFDEEALTNAVATQRRAANALEQLHTRGGKKTLAFCVSQRHARFMADYFVDHGMRAVAVHSGEGSAPRALSLEQLSSGDLDVVCAVDMFNEGVDVPEIDTVMMLRPTQSRILWLQQLGRGLRKSEDKTHLNVIDYIGNHKTFLLKPQTLFDLSPGRQEILNFLDRYRDGELELPPGCEVTYELETINILRNLVLTGRGEIDALRRYYEDFRDLQGIRPTASETFHDGYNPRATRTAHGSWFGLVRSMGDLDGPARAVIDANDEFLGALETTPMVKSFKMIVLLSMLNRDAFPGAMGIEQLGVEVARMAAESALLQDEFGDALKDTGKMRRLLESNPIEAWTGGRGTGGRPYFEYVDGEFRSLLASDESRSSLQELVREIIEWRLAEYLDRAIRGDLDADRFVAKVSYASGRPILFLPDRERNPDIPTGETNVVVAGTPYVFDFVKIAVNVARSPGDTSNELPRLLREWFGADAGLPGTRAAVVFERHGDSWQAAPEGQRKGELELWRQYSREQIPGLFGMEFSTAIWNVGYVWRGRRVFLLVTLDKGGHTDNFKYGDRFLSSVLFEWQSQNRTAANGKDGLLIREHSSRNIPVHLFVRGTKKISGGRSAPFVYCGDVTFADFEGERPMTVRWSLQEPVPERLRDAFRVSEL